MSLQRKTPAWVWAIIIGLALIEPVTHGWIAYFPPEGTAPTGLHIGDSGYFLQPMRMFGTGFFSPYATCKSPHGAHHAGFFSLPDNYMYGVLGLIANLLHIDHFLFLGIANGAGLAVYLFIVYRFLCEIVPQHANLAFVLFTLGGGPGGVLYLVTGALGLHHAPMFDAYFQRYAWYELIEEGNLTPVLQMVRLYKTLPLAFFFGALLLFFKGYRLRNARWIALSTIPLFVGTLLNVVYGPVVWGLGVCYLYCRKGDPIGKRAAAAGVFAVPVFLAGVAAWGVLNLNPVALGNALALRRCMWFSPFVSAILLHLFVAPIGVARGIRRLPAVGRLAALAAVGYLAAFTVLYCLYQAYYGNVLRCLEYTAAVRISDWALIGAAIGAGFGLRRPAVKADGVRHDEEPDGWTTLWLLGFVAVALSAFGQGWFLRFSPKRLMFLIGLPICIHSAEGLHRLETNHPRIARGLLAAFLACGACTIAVTALFFQGPLGRQAGEGPFAHLHAEVMSPADAEALSRLGPGVVLTPASAPPYFGDIIALRPGNSVVFAQGTLNFSDQPMADLGEHVGKFFNPAATDAFRRGFVEEWCVDYVYCPDRHPVDTAVLDALRSASWLEEIAQCGDAVVFKVIRPPSHNQGETQRNPQ